jgi:hypothetical protein
MKNYQRRATLAAAQACAKEVNAASAVVRAIACSSMGIGRQFDKKDRRSDGKASVRRSDSAGQALAGPAQLFSSGRDSAALGPLSGAECLPK